WSFGTSMAVRFQRTSRQARGKSSSRPTHARQLSLDQLEDRRMLSGNPIVVTTLTDSTNLNDGVTSLREAIFAANTVPGVDSIAFAPTLTAGGPAKIVLTLGELKITEGLTITGPGADRLTIDASGNDTTPGVADAKGTDIFNINDGDNA